MKKHSFIHTFAMYYLYGYKLKSSLAYAFCVYKALKIVAYVNKTPEKKAIL